MRRADRDKLAELLATLGREDDPDEVAIDEHQRYELYREALAGSTPNRERELMAIVLADPDTAMRDSAIVAHIDRSAAPRTDIADFMQWYGSVRDLLDRSPFARRRGEDWLIVKEAESGDDMQNLDVENWSDWLQRKLSEETPSLNVLRSLAESGRSRRIRSTAHRRLSALSSAG